MERRSERGRPALHEEGVEPAGARAQNHRARVAGLWEGAACGPRSSAGLGCGRAASHGAGQRALRGASAGRVARRAVRRTAGGGASWGARGAPGDVAEEAAAVVG